MSNMRKSHIYIYIYVHIPKVTCIHFTTPGILITVIIQNLNPTSRHETPLIHLTTQAYAARSILRQKN